MKITNINLASKLIKNSLNSGNWSSLPYGDHGFSEDNSNIGLEEGKRKGNFWILMKNPIHHLWAPLNGQVRHLLYHYNQVDIHEFHVFQSHQRTTKFHEKTDGFLGHQFGFLKDIWEPHLFLIARCSIFYITTVIYHNCPCLSALRMVLILGRALIQFPIFRVLAKDMLHSLQHTFSGRTFCFQLIDPLLWIPTWSNTRSELGTKPRNSSQPVQQLPVTFALYLLFRNMMSKTWINQRYLS